MTPATSLRALLLVTLCAPAAAAAAAAQVTLSGRLTHRPATRPGDEVPLTAVLCFASLPGADAQPAAFRTWETRPAGYFRLSGPPGNYTAVFSTPAHFARPLLVTNLFLRQGEALDGRFHPPFQHAVFHDREWDRRPGHRYWQPFTAAGTSVTHVGFRLAHDGVDGAGPGSQTLLVSIHRRTDGSPETWPQVGPTVPVLQVDSGGPKNYAWSAGFHSGDVPLVIGQAYAVQLRAEDPARGFQPFWKPADGDADGEADADAPACFRAAPGERPRPTDRSLHLSVAGDGDGLLVPCNKRVHRQFTELSRFGRRWCQTYVAQGRSLASVILYAATSGVQPSMNRQRVLVRVRRGGPDGPIVGTPKVAVGNANYTGDASWGCFGLAFAPGEVPLEPGRTYCLDFESMETERTLAGFVNIKGQPSDRRPGFNPYRRHPLDAYERGRAFFLGTEPVEYDLDVQVIEYEHAASGDAAMAVEPENLVRGAWKPLGASAPAMRPAQDGEPAMLRFSSPKEAALDAGVVQRIDGLNPRETYRLSALVRSSHALSETHQVLIGHDPAGGLDPGAPTVTWAALPPLSGRFIPFTSEPIRPRGDSITLFLRARCAKADFAFTADVADVELRQVRTAPPRPLRPLRPLRPGHP